MVETNVTYLGVQITHGSRSLSSDQVQGILQLPSPTTRKQLQCFLGLTGYCRVWIPNYGLIAQLKGTGWFNPTDVGSSSKEGRGYTKRSLNSGTCLEVARPRKSIPTLCPWKKGNILGSVNSKVGIWAPPCSLLIQEARPNFLRLPPLPSKSCSYCNPDRRCFKTLFWGQTIFTSHQVKQLNRRGHYGCLIKESSDIK